LPLVDIGSGAGQFAGLCSRWFGIEVIGVEPSEGMRAEAAASNEDSRVSYLAGDAQDLPLPDESCGAAWYSTVIHHIPDLTAAAHEARRVLAAGAPVLVRSAFPGRTEGITLFRFFPEAASVVETFPSLEQLTEAFGQAGFALERLESVRQVSVNSLREFRERVMLRADTTLRGISDEQFAAGIARLDEAIRSEQTDAQPLVDWLDLVVLR
jgi:ubiquinone/menaquinone biosynthesis C-methylase UbiE